jgi:hypothetical protein
MMAVAAAAVAAVAAVTLCGCTAGVGEEREDGDEVASTSTPWTPATEDSPLPVDPRLVNPIPINPFDQPGGLRDLDVLDESWERNPMSRGCYMTYVAIYDPTKSKKIEVPLTVCH